jgi:hypothetical protein
MSTLHPALTPVPPIGWTLARTQRVHAPVASARRPRRPLNAFLYFSLLFYCSLADHSQHRNKRERERSLFGSFSARWLVRGFSAQFSSLFSRMNNKVVVNNLVTILICLRSKRKKKMNGYFRVYCIVSSECGHYFLPGSLFFFFLLYF